MRGPTQNASTRDPRPADPFHHQALKPSEYPSDVAPTVELAPMLAARKVAPRSPGPSRRPATKKSPAPARRPINIPMATKRIESAARNASCSVKLFQVPGGGVAGDPARGSHRADDRLRGRVGGGR